MAMHKPIAIVIALRNELAPLLRGTASRHVNGLELFELEFALVVVAGIGRTPAQRAAQIAIREARPEVLVSAGFAGAAKTTSRVGDVLSAGQVVDAANGMRHNASGGNAVIVTAAGVTGMAEKRKLAAQFGADAIDMEAAAVAQVASEHGIPFAALKAISDELDFVMPPMDPFVTEDGRFRTVSFVRYVALRPRRWKSVLQLARNSAQAGAKLSTAVEHLIGQYSQVTRTENIALA